MIPQNNPQNNSQNNTRHYMTKPLELLKKLQLTPEQMSFSEKANKSFRFKVPVAFVDKIEVGNPDDPLLRQIFPIQQETLLTSAYHNDPLDEANYCLQPGLLQKYYGRALLLVTPSCAIHCRYCFRRHYPYDEKGYCWQQIEDNIQVIEKDHSISEVILSGGDPLSLSDHRFSQLIDRLNSIAHLKRLRIHTRFPIVEPQRITDNFLQILTSSQLQTIIVFHINHAQEIGLDSQKSIAKLHKIHCLLFNQSVLLKGVNDHIDQLEALSEALVNNHIVPYYLHLLDKVQGCAHFSISDKQAIELYLQLRARLPGYMLPRLVREIPGEISKTPLYL